MSVDDLKSNHIRSIVVATLILVALLGAGLIWTLRSITNAVQEECFANLSNAVYEYASDMQVRMRYHKTHLRSLAEVLSQSSDIHDTQVVLPLLAAFNHSALVTHVSIWYPDGRVLREDGQIVYMPSSMSFAAEAGKGIHVSDDVPSVFYEGQRSIRVFAPIVKDGATVALVYQAIYLDSLKKVLTVDIYDGRAQFFIIDSASGRYLMDNWHKDLSSRMDMLYDREYGQGYSATAFIDDLKASRPGRTVFRSLTSGELLYTVYQPVGINQWQAVLSVMEPDALAIAKISEYHLVKLVILFLAAFIVFLLWIRFISHLILREKEDRLDMISFISEIEQALFDFHLNPHRMAQAMAVVARTVQASYAFILIIEEGHIRSVFQGNKESKAIAGLAGQSLQVLMPHWQAQWVQNLSTQCSLGQAPEPERALLAQLGLADCYGLPVFDADQGLHAVCCISGWDGSDRHQELLQHIVIAFAMALNNREAHETIEQLGRMDMNTGLWNRNAYLSFAAAYRPVAGQAVTCVYADVNGLHEMNNRLGHEAGDRMLQTVAACLHDAFPQGCNYRLGGDEFLSIVFGQDLEWTEAQVRHIQTELTKQAYSVSFGIVRDDQGTELDTIVEQADQHMLTAKRHYYETIGDRRQH